MTIRLNWLATLAMLSLALAACGAAPPQASTAAVAAAAPTEEAAVTDEARGTPSPARPIPTLNQVIPTPDAAPVTGAAPADLLDAIKQDAAQRSGVDVASIVVQRDEAVEWGDSSLGCPQPGMAYMQVITPGYLVILQAGPATYDYRASDRGRFMLCQK